MLLDEDGAELWEDCPSTENTEDVEEAAEAEMEGVYGLLLGLRQNVDPFNISSSEWVILLVDNGQAKQFPSWKNVLGAWLCSKKS